MTKFPANKIWMILSAFLLITLIVYIVSYPPFAKAEKTVATVNGVTISTSQLYDAMLESGGEQTLESLISQELINQEGKKANIQVTEADLTKELDSVKSSFPSEEQFEQTLQSYGMSIDDLKKQMKTQVVLKKILEPQVTVTDDEIKSYYDTNLETIKVPEQFKASHIVVATKEEAEQIAADLKNGADFTAIAQQKSTDTATKDKGGDLGFMTSDMVKAAFGGSDATVKVGAVSGAVQAEGGYEITKVTDHKDAYTPTLDEKKASIGDTLKDQKVTELSTTWLQQKKDQSKVETFLSKA